MLALISSIPSTVRDGFDAQDLPPRASTMSEDTLENVFGGECGGLTGFCGPLVSRPCCSGLICGGEGFLNTCIPAPAV